MKQIQPIVLHSPKVVKATQVWWMNKFLEENLNIFVNKN